MRATRSYRRRLNLGAACLDTLREHVISNKTAGRQNEALETYSEYTVSRLRESLTFMKNAPVIMKEHERVRNSFLFRIDMTCWPNGGLVPLVNRRVIALYSYSGELVVGAVR